MKTSEIIIKLRELDQRNVYLLSKGDVYKLFPNEAEKTFEKSLQRLVKNGILEHVTKGLYLNPNAHSKGAYVIEDIARKLRRGRYSYISLESALSNYGVISQAPVSRITMMTSGAAGTYKTRYGTIEFTHSKRSVIEILSRSYYSESHRLRMATKEAAIQDLRRVGRNVDMMDTVTDDMTDDMTDTVNFGEQS